MRGAEKGALYRIVRQVTTGGAVKRNDYPIILSDSCPSGGCDAVEVCKMVCTYTPSVKHKYPLLIGVCDNEISIAPGRNSHWVFQAGFPVTAEVIQWGRLVIFADQDVEPAADATAHATAQLSNTSGDVAREAGVTERVATLHGATLASVQCAHTTAV